MNITLKHIVATLLISLVFSSCSFLEVEQTGKTDTDTFFKDMEGLRTACTGLYSTVYDFYDNNIVKYAETAGDCLQSVSSSKGGEMYYPYNFLSTPDLETTTVGFLWKQGYFSIINANTILNYIPSLKEAYPKNVDEILSIEGQAVFIRALVHFQLIQAYAQTYGFTPNASHPGLPYLDHVAGTDEELARISVAEFYKKINTDINKARGLLSEALEDTDYVTLRACDALQSRVYLYMNDWIQAEKYATIALEGLTLTSNGDYEAMFTGEEKGSEAIFSLTSRYASSRLLKFFDYESPDYYPVQEFVSEFEAGDVRVKLLSSPDGQSSCMKYYDLKSDSPVERFYRIRILRGSEMVLNRAEARCMQGNITGAAEDLKQIVARALGVAAETLAPGKVEQTDKDKLLQQIRQERKKELCFEGQRFFDISRYKEGLQRYPSTNSSLTVLSWPDYRFILPIPQLELDVNHALKQNDGY